MYAICLSLGGFAFIRGDDAMLSTSSTILVLNASLGGEEGNTAVLLARATQCLRQTAPVVELALSNHVGYAEIRPALAAAQALVIGTGTHWDSWSSRLQRFLEDATPDEGSQLWLGKPAGVIVTMHSVGGKGVLSRLQGVLSTFGCLIPPMSGLVHSLVGQAAINSGQPGLDDIWSPEDLDVLCHNVLASLSPKPEYRSWPVDRNDFSRRWIEP